MVQIFSLSVIVFLMVSCGKKDSNSGDGSSAFNAEKVALSKFNISKHKNVNLFSNQSFALTATATVPDSAVCAAEKKRVAAQKYLDSLKVYEKKCGTDITTGVRYKFGDGQKYLAEKISDTQVKVTHCLADESLYYFIDFETLSADRGKFSLRAGDSYYSIDRYYTDENLLKATVDRSSSQSNGIVSKNQFVAELNKGGISLVTNSDYDYDPSLEAAKAESTSRQAIKLNATKGMYYSLSVNPNQAAPYDNIEKTIYFNPKTYVATDSGGATEYQSGGILYVGSSDLPAPAKDVTLKEVEGAWNCKGFDEEISTCTENTEPAPSDGVTYPCQN